MGVAVDLVIFTVQEQRLELLLIRMKREPFTGKWALPGGRIRGNETVEAAAERELREKTGLKGVYLEQLYTFSEPQRDPEARCISVGHMALIRGDVQLSTTDKYTGIGWFPMAKLPSLAFDHEQIAKYAVKRLRAKLEYTDVARNLLEKTFTLGELQRLYETILGKPVDARNFQRRAQAHWPGEGYGPRAARTGLSSGAAVPVRLTILIVTLTISIDEVTPCVLTRTATR